MAKFYQFWQWFLYSDPLTMSIKWVEGWQILINFGTGSPAVPSVRVFQSNKWVKIWPNFVSFGISSPAVLLY